MQFSYETKETVIKIVIQDIFLKSLLNVLKNYINFTMIYHFTEKIEN